MGGCVALCCVCQGSSFRLFLARVKRRSLWVRALRFYGFFGLWSDPSEFAAGRAALAVWLVAGRSTDGNSLLGSACVCLGCSGMVLSWYGVFRNTDNEPTSEIGDKTASSKFAKLPMAQNKNKNQQRQILKIERIIEFH